MGLRFTIALIVCFRTGFIGRNGTNIGTSSRFWNNNCFFTTTFSSSFTSFWGDFSTSTFLSSETPAPSFPFKSFYKVRMKKELDIHRQYGRKREGEVEYTGKISTTTYSVCVNHCILSPLTHVFLQILQSLQEVLFRLHFQAQ